MIRQLVLLRHYIFESFRLLTKLPVMFSTFTDLQKLVINNCHLEELPVFVGHLTALHSCAAKA
jgi:hypothetical protein